MKADEELRMNLFPEFSVARHTVIEELFESLFEGAPNRDGDIGDKIGVEFATVDHEGEVGTMGIDEAIEGIKKTGIFGFVDEAGRVIHVWFDKEKISFEYLVFFFGHEIGHTVKELDVPDGYDFDEETKVAYLEEMRADEYAFAAKEAYRCAMCVWE